MTFDVLGALPAFVPFLNAIVDFLGLIAVPKQHKTIDVSARLRCRTVNIELRYRSRPAPQVKTRRR